MKQQPPERTKRLAVIAAAAVMLVMVLLIIETFRLLLPGLWTAFSSGDEQALSDYLTSEGRLRSFLTLWFLAFVQVVSLVIPAMPVQLAAGIAYGPWKRLCDQLFGIGGGKLSGVSAGAPPGKSH